MGVFIVLGDSIVVGRSTLNGKSIFESAVVLMHLIQGFMEGNSRLDEGLRDRVVVLEFVVECILILAVELRIEIMGVLIVSVTSIVEGFPRSGNEATKGGELLGAPVFEGVPRLDLKLYIVVEGIFTVFTDSAVVIASRSDVSLGSRLSKKLVTVDRLILVCSVAHFNFKDSTADDVT